MLQRRDAVPASSSGMKPGAKIITGRQSQRGVHRNSHCFAEQLICRNIRSSCIQVKPISQLDQRVVSIEQPRAMIRGISRSSPDSGLNFDVFHSSDFIQFSYCDEIVSGSRSSGINFKLKRWQVGE
jgi:hypothetical protein